jgi:hypothetical protein
MNDDEFIHYEESEDDDFYWQPPSEGEDMELDF